MHDHDTNKDGGPLEDYEHLAHVYEQVSPEYWDESYKHHALQRLYHDLRFRVLRRMIAAVPRAGRVLDIGCGGGFSIERTVEGRPDLEVYGVDVTDALIAYAREHRPRFHFAKAFAEKLPHDDGFFDAVLMLDVIEHVVDADASLREARRVLKPGGRMIILVVLEHHPLFRVVWWLWLRLRGKVWHEAHLRVFDRASVTAALTKAGFSVLTVTPLHLGMSVAVLGRKPL